MGQTSRVCPEINDAGLRVDEGHQVFVAYACDGDEDVTPPVPGSATPRFAHTTHIDLVCHAVRRVSMGFVLPHPS